MNSPTSGSKSSTAALGGLLLAAAAIGVALTGLLPPAPRPADADPELFSAERARAHVERLAAVPRPGGTPAHAAARDDLVERLNGMGLETEVQVTTALLPRAGGRVVAARVENVVARRPGSDSDGAVLLMAHYDSRPRTYGAGDDAAGAAAVLEVVRALGASEPLAHELIVLLTDAEEVGLMGARAFAAEHPWAERVSVVFNLEARGNSGPANMFETGPGNFALVRRLAAAGHPFASSLGYEVYRRMPNDTDFTVFRRRGIPGLNFAFINGHPAYHSMLDTTESLSSRSLQHLGEQALTLVRGVGGRELPAAAGGDGIFFNPLRGWLVVYPATWALPLLVAAGLLALVALGVGLRAKRIGLAGVAAGTGLGLAALAGSGLVGFLFWWAIARFFPALLVTPHSLPYGTPLFGAALAALTLAWCFWVATWQPRLRSLEVAAGALVVWLALAVATTLLMPGASYLFLWPAVVLGLALVVGTGRARSAQPLPVGAIVLLSIAAAAAVAIHTPVTALVVEALTLRLSFGLAVLMALPALSLLPLAREAQPGSKPWVSLALALGGVLLWGAALFGARPSAETPRTDTLFYVLDAEEGEARWWSYDPVPDEWTRRFLGDDPQRDTPPFAHRGGPLLWAPAPPADLSAPRLEVLSEVRRGTPESRTLEVRVRSTRGAAKVRVEAESSVPIRLVSVAGKPIERPGRDADDDGFEQRVTLDCFAPAPEGVRFVIEVPGRWPVEARVIDQSYQLPQIDPATSPRPPHLMPGVAWRTDSTFVVKTVFF